MGQSDCALSLSICPHLNHDYYLLPTSQALPLVTGPSLAGPSQGHAAPSLPQAKVCGCDANGH